ncbi:MAG TPA: nicotinate-nucleotide--dimethylbenzimidazole phosphoribosyltransferase, partial [Petrotogaceae bacterium]|nr:nicotinate-nucleotide--dimethylbenzimidazole phosphoribosyltransferase [Petrotogaceae bacterium]
MLLNEKVQKKIDMLTKPKGSLGLLEKIALKYALIQGSSTVSLPKDKRVYVFAGDHGVVEQGVSAYPKEVTAQMVFNFLAGGAAINVFSKHNNTSVYIVDAGVDYDFSSEPRVINKKVGRSTKDFSSG